MTFTINPSFIFHVGKKSNLFSEGNIMSLEVLKSYQRVTVKRTIEIRYDLLLE